MPTRTIKRILNSTFMSRSRIIFVGTLISQIITFATSFVITGFFNPEDLGLLGTLTALISIISGTFSFRLELAILNSDQKNAPTVFWQSSLLSMTCTTIFCTLCLVLPWDFARKISGQFLPFLLWSWAYILFFNSRQLPFKFNQLKEVSNGSIIKSAFTFFYQLAGGILNPSFGWLLSGRIAGDYVGALVHTKNYFKLIDLKSASNGWGKFVRKHKDHFFYMAPHYLCIALSTHMIILFLDRGYGLVIVGFFSLGQRLIQAPVEIIGSTLFNVANQRFSELKAHKNELKSFFTKVVIFSLTISLIIGAIIFFTIDYFLPFLGPKWSGASSMTKALIPLFMTTLITTPSSNFLRFIDRTKFQLGIEILDLSLKMGLLLFFKFDVAENLVLSYSLLSFSLSLIKVGIIYYLFSRTTISESTKS
jgi:O-antigen/teichoic acid export membrane protein